MSERYMGFGWIKFRLKLFFYSSICSICVLWTSFKSPLLEADYTYLQSIKSDPQGIQNEGFILTLKVRPRNLKEWFYIYFAKIKKYSFTSRYFTKIQKIDFYLHRKYSKESIYFELANKQNLQRLHFNLAKSNSVMVGVPFANSWNSMWRTSVWRLSMNRRKSSNLFKNFDRFSPICVIQIFHSSILNILLGMIGWF